MMELLQEKNRGKIVFCNAGNFYVAIGKDAVILNRLLDLKVSCFKQEICKVGFPINSLEKYLELIYDKKYGYIVYFFDQEKEELEVITEYDGKNKNRIMVENINCYICKHSTEYYKKEDKYIKALAKLYDKEIHEEEQEKKENRKDYKKICQINKNKKTN